jgi:hypothetical protein
MTSTSSVQAAGAEAAPSDARGFLVVAVWFVLIGLVLYAGLYAVAELVVRAYAERNRFHVVRSSPPTRYDYLILGASHAAVLGYRDMNARLEQMTGKRIMNLSIVGGGVVVNELMFDYFLTRHQTGAAVYIVDSFGFYSSDWNERRLEDTRLFVRADFDLRLVWLLARNPGTRAMALDYLVGFSKINDRDRFLPDVPVEEGARFDRTYRPVAQIDRERMAYLYPGQIDQAVFGRYMDRFAAFLDRTKQHGIDVVVVKPPIPDRVLRLIPGEEAFDARLTAVLAGRNVPFHDFSRAGNDDRWFYDTDHLNQAGVLQFFETSLSQVLAGER